MSNDYLAISNKIIDFLLSKISTSSFLNQSNGTKYDVFNVNNKIKYKVDDYVKYIVSTLRLEEITLIYSLILIHKFVEYNRDFHITYANVFKIIYVSIYLSSKLLEDFTYSHQEFSRIGGFKSSVLSTIESEFIEGMGYNVIFYNENIDFFNEFKLSL